MKSGKIRNSVGPGSDRMQFSAGRMPSTFEWLVQKTLLMKTCNISSAVHYQCPLSANKHVTNKKVLVQSISTYLKSVASAFDVQPEPGDEFFGNICPLPSLSAQIWHFSHTFTSASLCFAYGSNVILKFYMRKLSHEK